jgi:Na+/H+ antiporter NhaC
MAAGEEEETQKKGMVAIIVNIGKNRAVNFAHSSRRITAMTSWLPCRLSALHFCVDDTASSAVAAVAMLMLGSRVRARVRKHEGELREW